MAKITLARLWAFISLLSMSLTTLSAELMIVSVDNKGYIQPLAMDSLTSEMKQDLFGIMMKYQWPSNTAYALSNDLLVDECAQIFGLISNAGQSYLRLATQKVRSVIQKIMGSQSCTEQDFIRAAIQAKCGKSYDVVYVPTTLYELFVLKYIFEGTSSEFMKHVQTLDMIAVDDEVKTTAGVQDNKLKDVFKAYRTVFELGLAHDGAKKLAGSSGVYTPLRELYFEANEQCVKYLCQRLWLLDEHLAYHKQFSRLNVRSFSNALEEWRLFVGASLVNDLVAAAPSATFMQTEWRQGQSKVWFSYDALKNELAQNSLTLDEKKPLAKTLAREYEALKSNRALLFRGTSFLNAMSVYDQNFPSLLDTTLCTDPKGLVFGASQFDKLVPRSICYGNSLFAGGLNDLGAMVYCYWVMPDRSGYVLEIDKAAYFKNQCDNLFFISPLPTLLALFGCGQFFHSRTKAVTRIADTPIYIDGVQHGDYADYAGFLLYKGIKAIEFEKCFSAYLAEHAYLIKTEEGAFVTESVLRASHRKLAYA